MNYYSVEMTSLQVIKMSFSVLMNNNFLQIFGTTDKSIKSYVNVRKCSNFMLSINFKL